MSLTRLKQTVTADQLVFEFTETVDGATYTATAAIQPGTRIVDVLIETTADWTAATADLLVGDSDGADALIVDSVNLQLGHTGADAFGSDWGPNGAPYSTTPTGAIGKFYPAGDTITAAVTATGPGGPTGFTRVVVWLLLPTSAVQAVAAP